MLPKTPDNNLLDALIKGDPNEIKALIAQGADVNVLNEHQDSALKIAIRIGNIEIVTALLDADANVNSPNANGDTPLCIASSFGIIGDKTARLEILQALINKGAQVNLANQKDGMNPLSIAAENGHTEVVEVLLKNEANIEARNDKNSNFTPLHYAAENGHAKVVEVLLKNGAPVDFSDKYDNTPLHFAARNGHTEIVKALLTGEGIDINARENSKWTPLHYAARNGHIEVVEVLLKNGAPVDLVSDEYDTPLHYAAQNGHTKVVEVLLKNGANIEAEGTYYNQLLEIDFTALTPLHYAAEWCQAKVVELLLKNGACVSKMAVGDKDYSAMEWVLSEDNNNLDIKDEERDKVINILFKYGANISPELLEETINSENISDTTKELVTELSQPERILARDEALREDPDLIEDYKNFILNGKLTLDSANTLVLYNESFGDLIVKAINSITKEELKTLGESSTSLFIDDLLAISSSKINEIKKRRTDNVPPANSEALQAGASSSSQEVNPTLGEKRSNSNFSASRRAEAGSPAKASRTEGVGGVGRGVGELEQSPSSSTSLSGKREREEGSANTQLAGESLTKKPNTGEVNRGN